MNQARACRQIIKLLNEIICIVKPPETDVVWSRYDAVEDVASDLSDHIARLNNKDLSRLKDLELLFAPTGDLQELSISNGWGNQFLDLASSFDHLVVNLEKKSPIESAREWIQAYRQRKS